MSDLRQSPPPPSDPVRELLDVYRDLGITDYYLTSASKKLPVSDSTPVATRPEISGGLDAYRLQEVGNCTRCKLHRQRKTIVFGEGNSNAELMLIGEAPGADEDEQGRPFVGRAGQLLMQMIKAIQFERQDVYIANVIKCRPPGNRPPEPDEIKSCSPFLMKQIEMIRPKIILALGTFAAQTLLSSTTSITYLRGKIYDMPYGRVIATYHPSFLLRSPQKKPEAWEDLKLVKRTLEQS